MASAGNNVVVDHVLGERWRLTDCLEVFAGLSVYFVGIHCELPELERRELTRGNRTIGRAAVQFPLVHRGLQYDVAVHTDQQSPAECAQQIAERLQTPPVAFGELVVSRSSR